MVSGGRVVCVAFPFVLAVISIITLLIAGLAGVTSKSLYIFQVNTTGLSISESELLSLLSRRSDERSIERRVDFHDTSLLAKTTTTAAAAAATTTTTTTSTSSSSNITASDLSIGKLYDISIWNYCETLQSGKRNCSKTGFNWAAGAVNATEESLTTMAAAAGKTLKLPKTVRAGLVAFEKLSHWTQIVFLIALVSLALEIVVGFFTSCSKTIACLTYLVAILAVLTVTVTAGLASATGIVIVAVVRDDLKKYGVTASLNSHYMAVIWISAGAAIAASFFWMLSVCCCKPESRRLRGPAVAPAVRFNDKSVPVGSYQPLNDPNHYNNSFAPQYGAPRQTSGRADLAYEPYSHSRV
ncbi:integral membrane protein [Grosmannia clavigera kw1407]|uniref:Integral membrane protein n=1 Tax=Grosmannia clavigera (strain kw1407 / UAMH 11150) TaxID=655863 RepID=F0XAJ7_GROCL|nr:uncharacterized protein CMQ_3322 [Grosmannia clavigera kw1407]EFX05253.1 integral membrane protein [Grosmannia clavigera kw1407]